MTVKDKDGNITSCIFANSGDAINEVLLKAAGEGIFGIDLQGKAIHNLLIPPRLK